MCLEEATGKLLWQLPIPRMKTKDSNFNFDQLNLGVCSSPTVDGDRVYLVTNRCEVLCLDVQGQANGNDGPFTDEGQYMAGTGDLPTKPGRFDKKDAPAPPPPVTLGPTDGDIVWRFDILAEVDSWPQDAADCSVVVLGDYVYVCTSNGVDKSHHVRPSPNCPDLIVLDKKTGELVAVSDPPIGNGIFHGDWSSPSLAKVNGKDLVIWGGGDGVCYAFDPVPVPGENGKKPTIRSAWKFDCNPPHNKIKDGKPLPYNKSHEGPSEIIGTPVFYKNRIYVAIGQDPLHGRGKGLLHCIDATKTGDITQTGRIWTYDGLDRTISNATIAAGLLYIPDIVGRLHCLDADTGKCYWVYETNAETWGTPLAADGRVYLGTQKAFFVFAAGKEARLLSRIPLGAPSYCTPIAANGVLYVASHRYLWAVKQQKKP